MAGPRSPTPRAAAAPPPAPSGAGSRSAPAGRCDRSGSRAAGPAALPPRQSGHKGASAEGNTATDILSPAQGEPPTAPAPDTTPAPDPAPEPAPDVAPAALSGGLDPDLLDELILSGDWIATSSGPFPVGDPLDRIDPAPPELLEHERNLLAVVLQGPEDRRELWGIFRRRLGLRFNERCPSGSGATRSCAGSPRNSMRSSSASAMCGCSTPIPCAVTCASGPSPVAGAAASSRPRPPSPTCSAGPMAPPPSTSPSPAICSRAPAPAISSRGR